ncbi:M12 family metallo-peptidase [Sodalis sp. RH23]|uniref:M12 family metallo-peptidase n=1 Tax=unclassified Sodalis (in: enterobacteria) TaxID=2636512 RepID=UPI0039B39BA9
MKFYNNYFYSLNAIIKVMSLIKNNIYYLLFFLLAFPFFSSAITLSPNQVPNGQLPSGFRNINFHTANGNWAAEIHLPQQPLNDDRVSILSRATLQSRIMPQRQLFASTTTLLTNDNYIFIFRTDLNRWVITSSPPRDISVQTIINNGHTIPRPTSPLTRVNFNTNTVLPLIRLPLSANNRDLIRVHNGSTPRLGIDNVNLNFNAPVYASTGQQYAFRYIAENPSGRRWQIVTDPLPTLQASSLTNGVIPALQSPRARIQVSNDNYQQRLTLPNNQAPGYRLIVETRAALSFNVIAGNRSFPIYDGETVSFVTDNNRQWQRETVTIDMLIIYSQTAVARIGAAAVRTRNIESFNLINEALENSGANFRVRLVGMRQFNEPANWNNADAILSSLNVNTQIQSWRRELRADAVYYTSIWGPQCGLAFLNGQAHRDAMFGYENLLSSCNRLTIMRHEFGHNMGVFHGGVTNATPPFAVGNSLARTIMGGNAIPFFSTPLRFTDDLGLPLGTPNLIDAVRTMNNLSQRVSNFY